MTDYTNLQSRCQRGEASLSGANNLLAECHAELGKLIAESERLKSDLRESNDLVEHLGDKRKSLTSERDQLRAEIAGLKTGYEAYERVNAELKAENDALRNALAECINSLKGEMLQKFGGLLPEDMHPVTRREYDRDVAELYGYRAALGKGDQS